jgi:RNAse (barnase) inhibitor barstar
MRIEILDLAKKDLLDGFHFYEQKEQSLGDYFLTNLFADIERLKILEGIHSRSHRGFYRALSKRFPFAIYYTVADSAIWIRSVVDCRRRPSWIREHLKGA